MARDSEEAHALTTVGVSKGWGEDPEGAVALLNESRSIAAERGDLDELFRIIANLTTVLDLVGRRTEAAEIAYEGIAEARRVGLEAVYGNFLRANAADSLFLLGRWAESRELLSAGKTTHGKVMEGGCESRNWLGYRAILERSASTRAQSAKATVAAPSSLDLL